MFKSNFSSKLIFNDWLYCLLYDVELITTNNHASITSTFDTCRKARFRFDRKDLFAEEAISDPSYQYGNYFLSKISLEENFVALPAESIAQDAAAKINAYAHKLSFQHQPDIHSAVNLIVSNIQHCIPGNALALSLDTENIHPSKRAPFGTMDFFESYIIFSKTQSGRLLYFELGAD